MTLELPENSDNRFEALADFLLPAFERVLTFVEAQNIDEILLTERTGRLLKRAIKDFFASKGKAIKVFSITPEYWNPSFCWDCADCAPSVITHRQRQTEFLRLEKGERILILDEMGNTGRTVVRLSNDLAQTFPSKVFKSGVLALLDSADENEISFVAERVSRSEFFNLEQSLFSILRSGLARKGFWLEGHLAPRESGLDGVRLLRHVARTERLIGEALKRSLSKKFDRSSFS